MAFLAPRGVSGCSLGTRVLTVHRNASPTMIFILRRFFSPPSVSAVWTSFESVQLHRVVLASPLRGYWSVKINLHLLPWLLLCLVELLPQFNQIGVYEGDLTACGVLPR
jgi:hypothetical protein